MTVLGKCMSQWNFSDVISMQKIVFLMTRFIMFSINIIK